MGDKSGVSEQIISVPKGGGALRGIGEGFAADLHTGAGAFTVPIALPRGRNGFQPELRLVYSTGTGNGPFGFGWNLGVAGVARKTSRGIPQYHDETDTFILSGAEDLVPVERLDADLPGVARTRYQPRTEGLFARIVHERSALEDYWEVRTKDGLISCYGTPRPASASADWIDPGVLADPENGRRIAAWRLTETRDPFGNRIRYEYDADTGSASGRRWSQLYLKRIRYVDFGEPQAQQFLVSVEFSYADRPDPFSDYRSAFETRTTRRCKRIEIHTHAQSDLRARSYDFIYLDERTDLPDLAASMPPNKASLLSQILVVGHDGDVEEAMPPAEFGYTAFAPKDRKFAPLTGPGLPATSLAHPNLELADLFGTGLPDIFEMGASVRYWRNRGAGRFDLPREMRAAPTGLQLGDANVQLLDADGDGRVDLLVNSTAMSGYFPLRFDGTWDARSFRRYRQAPSFDLKDPEVRLLDLDGDGVTDALRSGTRLEAFFNDPEKGWTRTRFVERRTLEDFPDVSFSDPRVKWGDMSGDGMQDIVLVHDGACVYWPNLGYGDWARPVHMRNSPRFPFGYDPRRILVADVDGDGAADIVYVDDTRVTLWINQSGNGWSEPIVIGGTPPVTDMDAVRLVDMLGTGVSGVLWSADFEGMARQGMYFLDFTGGTKPYLLSEMDNHMGAVTRVELCAVDALPAGGPAEAGHALANAAALSGAGRRAGRGHRRAVPRQAHDRVPLPPRLLGRRRARVPRLRDGRAVRHGDLRAIRPGRGAARSQAWPTCGASRPRPAPGRGSTRVRSTTGRAIGKSPTRARNSGARTPAASITRPGSTPSCGRCRSAGSGATHCGRCAARSCAPSSMRRMVRLVPTGRTPSPSRPTVCVRRQSRSRTTRASSSFLTGSRPGRPSGNAATIR